MYLIADTETGRDADRIVQTSPVASANAGETKEQTADRLLKTLCDDRNVTNGTVDRECFTPARLQSPNTIVSLLVDDEMRFQGKGVIANWKDGKPDIQANVKSWWETYAYLKKQIPKLTLVTFNGLHFDMPMLEVGGLQYGCDLSGHLLLDAPTYKDPRSPYACLHHLDLFAFLASRAKLGGSLDFWAKLFGLAGKLSTSGGSVAEILEQIDGRERLIDYCTTDVLNTYGVLWRVLYCMRLLPTDYRGAVFEHTMAQMADGRGAEVQAFITHYRSEGIF